MNVVEVKKLSKSFNLPLERKDTLKEHFWRLFRPVASKKLEVLKEISFDVKEGEWFGIIGRNGCGKSTLLKILAGIFTPEKGSVSVRGKVIPFLELGVGFNPELTARENIFLNGTMLGMKRKEIESVFDDIVDFAEIRPFLDMALKNFSSGMQVRLAFSIAIRAKGDVYLLDEVLAVGDALFQARCFNVLNQMKKNGKTVVIVTHDLNFIAQYCDRAIFINSGSIHSYGKAIDVVGDYISQNVEDGQSQNEEREENDNNGGTIPDIEITGVNLLNEDRKIKETFLSGDAVIARLVFTVHKNFSTKINFGIALFSEKDEYIFGTNTIIDFLDTKEILSRGYIEIEYPNIKLKTGTYYFKCGIFRENDQQMVDFLNQSKSFKIFSKTSTEGLVELLYKWK